MEIAAKNAKEEAQQDTASSFENVYRVTPFKQGKDTSSNRSKFTGTCFCCGRVGHKREKCYLKDTVCVVGLLTFSESVKASLVLNGKQASRKVACSSCQRTPQGVVR